MSREEERAGRGWLELIGVVIGALLLALLIQWALIKPYKIPSASMAPTLIEGQRVFVDRLGDHFGDPRHGQIVVFHPPDGAERPPGMDECALARIPGTACTRPTKGQAEATFIKRVLGVPGDRIALVGGHVVRNGARVPEPYAQTCTGEICDIREFTVPRGTYFMLGDNRDDSNDSRYWGPVRRDQVIGRAVATYWPLKRVGGL